MDKPHPNATLWNAGSTSTTGFNTTDIYMDPPTILGSSVGLPAKVLHIDPASGRIYRTV